MVILAWRTELLKQILLQYITIWVKWTLELPITVHVFLGAVKKCDVTRNL